MVRNVGFEKDFVGVSWSPGDLRRVAETWISGCTVPHRCWSRVPQQSVQKVVLATRIQLARTFSPPGKHQSNGRAEAMVASIKRVRRLLHAPTNMATKWWRKTCDGAGETTPREHQGADSSVWAVDRNKEEGLADYDGAGGKLRWLASRVKKRREEDHDDSSRPYDEEKTKRDAGGGSRHCFPTTGAGGFDATPGGG